MTRRIGRLAAIVTCGAAPIVTRTIWSLRETNAGWTQQTLSRMEEPISSFGEDNAGKTVRWDDC